MVKESDTLIASPCETVNGHSSVEQNEEYNELTKKLKEIAETPMSPYSLPKDKALESNGAIKNKLLNTEDVTISKLNSELSVIENGRFSEKKSESVPDPSKDQEFVFIHDAGFLVKIVAPGVEPFDIQVSSTELVQEIHQMLMDREETCHRTCFSLQLDGVTLDNFAELKTIDGLCEGSVIKVVEEPYTVREARIHVRHIRDLLKSLDPSDAYNGVECSSLSFLNTITQGDILGGYIRSSEKKKCRPDSVDCTPLDYILPEASDLPLLPLQPLSKDPKIRKVII
ncbi:hypothetical protein CDAR_281612 [Caerostris darwini]|uniref:Clustered mitochondria protein N-terminal domain-containing protein n=1 Tax=Caerostris darwini TaxID=1538125 RepID=A0AAV4UJ35_9ARAC|nr:hypothetical protein CDAR_281612 [Caerostris darwini]